MPKGFNKRKIGINVREQFKLSSECLLNSSLKLKEHPDAM